MRVFWYWPFAYPEELALAEAFATRGHDLTVQTIDRRLLGDGEAPSFRHLVSLPDVARFESKGVRWRLSRAATYIARARLRHLEVSSSSWDIVHVMFVNYFTDRFALPLLANQAPLLLSVHDVIPHTPRLPRPVLRALLAKIYSSCPTLVVHNEHVRDHLCREFAVRHGRVAVVPLPTTCSSGAKSPGFPKTQPHTLLFFGSFRENKGIPLLLAAIESTRSSQAALRFHFAGHGREDLENAVRLAARRDARITHDIGRITTERKHELFERACLVLLPYSHFQSQSGVLKDAYGFGVPVVASQSGFLGDIVRADQTGWTVDCSDPQEFARVLIGAVASQTEWLAASRNALRLAATRSPAAVAEQLEDVYRATLERSHA